MSKRTTKRPVSARGQGLRPITGRLKAALRGAWIAAWQGLGRALLAGESWLTSSKKALYGLSVFRILGGVAALGLLVSNYSTRLYTFGSGSAWNVENIQPTSRFSTMPVFSIMRMIAYDDLLFTAVYVAMIVLSILLILGYRTRLVLPVFWVLWVGLIELAPAVGDQSDNLSRILLLLIFFTDASSRWSLDARRRRRRQTRPGGGAIVRLWRGQPVMPSWFSNTVHNLALVLIVFQTICTYMAGGLFKAAGESWQHGTAIWGPLNVDVFNPFPVLSGIATASPILIAVASVMTVLAQVAFPFLLLNRWTRIAALLVMFSFHLAIGVLMGLPWFSMWMFAADAVLIRDLTYGRLGRWTREIVRPSGTRRRDEEAAATSDPDPERASDLEQAPEPVSARDTSRVAPWATT
ncbi:vitamin K-dependent gamma-carboxylase-like protein [Labedella gwakjiensis]|nr:HTTM domain-containing protein [Labedella gwakjiensis]PSL36969.1 vitamin K-dependent gamma-carboxylase-like protein [Labedella gwakjiensis]